MFGLVEEVVSPKRTLCDYDVPKAPPLTMLWAVARIVNLKPECIRYDRTARGWHVVIDWDRELSPAETVALQAVLGSDIRREALNLSRILSPGAKTKRGAERWNLLFKGKLKCRN